MSPSLGSGATLVLGGVRSGKSRFAETLAAESSYSKVYIATARVLDEELEDRVLIHQARRGDGWETVEEPLALTDTIRSEAHPGRVLLVDCLTFWITNLMIAQANVERETSDLISLLRSIEVPVILVSNEVGLGGIADNKMAREFADLNGTVNQRIAEMSSAVYLVAAGLPLKLKG